MNLRSVEQVIGPLTVIIGLAVAIAVIIRNPKKYVPDHLGGLGSLRHEEISQTPSVMEVVRSIAGDSAARNMVLGAVLVGVIGSAFWPLQFFATSLSGTNSVVTVMVGFSAPVGIAIGGLIAYLLGQRNRQWWAWTLCGAIILAELFFAMGLNQQSTVASGELFALGLACLSAYLPQSLAVICARPGQNMRTTSIALTLAAIAIVTEILGTALETGAMIIAGNPAQWAANFSELGGGGVTIQGSMSTTSFLPIQFFVTFSDVSALKHGISNAMILLMSLLIWPTLHFYLSGVSLAPISLRRNQMADSRKNQISIAVSSMPMVVVGVAIGFSLLAFVNKFDLLGNVCYYIGSFSLQSRCFPPWVYYGCWLLAIGLVAGGVFGRSGHGSLERPNEDRETK